METVTVLIYTYNSESHIENCIESAYLLTDRVLIIDQHSTDNTVKLAGKKGATVVTVPHHQFVESVRMAGIEQVKDGWLFILDADERMTKELAEEIKARINDNKLLITNYAIARKNIFARKKWLEHGGWYPDLQTRLIKRSAIKDWPEKIHSMPVIEGNRGELKKPMIHYFHGDIEGMVRKTIVFEQIEAGLLYDAKRASSTTIFFRKFFGELYRRLILHAGWRDGMVGVIENFYQAYSKTITYLFLYEKQKT